MSNMYVQARISNFIHRRQATIEGGETVSPRNATKTLGIYYETLALPRRVAKKER